ncbi:glutaminase B [Salmonella enterica subsp. enterica serovar Muenchen]|nr:glutaminase B [Salmonella enterica subsp. enterica serovar Muenchen]
MDNAILETILQRVRPLIGQGKVADYIPALASVEGSKLGIAICTVDGQHYQAGDAHERFSIQSISKVLSLVVAMRHYPEEEIWLRVGKDPSGSPFNSLVQLEMEQGIPRNPFINAGALVVCDMLQGRLSAPRQRMLEVVRALCGVSDITYDATVARSEFEHSARNAAIAWLMKSFGNFHHDVPTVLQNYFHYCALKMSCMELARTFVFLANQGEAFHLDEPVVTPMQARQINALMATSGMYQNAGEFAWRVGLPAKSGVGGGIVAIIRLIFVWHGSVLSKIFSRLLLNFLLSIAVIIMLPWYTMLGIKFTLAPFSILGVAIAIFLGFRNNACYARYVEARHLWGQLMIASRSILREVKTTLPDERGIEDFVRLQIAFAHCLRMTLRRQPQTQVLGNYLDQEALQKVVASHSPANRILLLMGEWLAIRRRSGKLSDILFHSLNNRLNDMSSVLAGCERIANTPVPFAYTLILHRTVYLFCIMLPFALVVDLHYMTPFISVLISYTFIALDALAEELEDPFGTENNDLPLDAICNAIEIDLLQMNDERDIPEKRIPDKRYQLT